jgi:zinc transporter ZupT
MTAYVSEISSTAAPVRTGTSEKALRAVAVTGLLVTAIVHMPVAAEHLNEVPYLGVAFYGFVLACAAAAGSLLVESRRSVWLGALTLNAAATVVYVVSRTFGLPAASDDRGDWTNTAGVICVTAQIVVVIACALALRGRSTSE